jgi:glutamate-1-semialdehyde 2,1-aminomutase
VNQLGSMLTVFFTDRPVTDFATASSSDARAFGRWFHAMLARGVAWPPSAYEAAFLSYAHDDALVEQVLAAAREAFAEVAAAA